jgi:exonuclease V gamma subunit
MVRDGPTSACGKIKTQWHVLSNCKENGIPALRKRYAKRRKKMMDKLNIPVKTQLCFIYNLGPDENGCYPDWSRTCAGKHMNKFKHQKEKKVVRLMKKHRGAAIH